MLLDVETRGNQLFDHVLPTNVMLHKPGVSAQISSKPVTESMFTCRANGMHNTGSQVIPSTRD